MTFIKKYFSFVSFGFVFGIFAFVPLLAFAQQNFVPLSNLPGLTDLGSAPTLPFFLNNLYKLCIGAAAVIAILQIMRAGFLLMYSTGSITGNEKAKDLIQNSLLGLLLVLSPALVFGIINPDILDLELDVSGLSSDKKSGVVSQDNTTVSTSPTAEDDCKAKGGTAKPDSSAQGAISCTLPTGTCPVFVSPGSTRLTGEFLENCCVKQEKGGCTVVKKTKATSCTCSGPLETSPNE